MKRHDLVFFRRRSTPQVVDRGDPARPKKGYGRQSSRRHATADEEKVIDSGRWLRVDEAGTRPSSSTYKVSRYRTRQGRQRARPNRRLQASHRATD